MQKQRYTQCKKNQTKRKNELDYKKKNKGLVSNILIGFDIERNKFPCNGVKNLLS